MFSRMATLLSAKRAAVALALLVALAIGYVASVAGGSDDPQLGGTASACGATVLQALSQVTQRVYDEGVSSERTEIAKRLIKGSHALREAIEHDDAGARAYDGAGAARRRTRCGPDGAPRWQCPDHRRPRRRTGAAAWIDPRRRGDTDRELRNERVGTIAASSRS